MADVIDDAALAANLAAQKTVELLIEGFQHELEATDLSSDARTHVQAILDDYKRRQKLLKAWADAAASVQAAFDGLVDDGHPEMPPRAVPASVLAEIQQNLASQQAARAKFVADAEVTGGTFVLGPAEPKPNP